MPQYAITVTSNDVRTLYDILDGFYGDTVKISGEVPDLPTGELRGGGVTADGVATFTPVGTTQKRELDASTISAVEVMQRL